MKKIIVISDTHGNRAGIDKLKSLFEENDYIIHLGDGAGDVREIMDTYPEKVYFCRGNCDFLPYPEEGELEIEGCKIFYCHGHKYGVKSGLEGITQEGVRRGADVVLYGHTHRALITQSDNLTLINPGSLKRPVGEGGGYCYLVIHGDKVTPVLVGESVY